MADPVPATGPPVTSVDEAIARMKQIDASLPATDGVACFNRMYLAVTEDVKIKITQGFFADPDFLAALDVAFANIYFAAVDAMTGPADAYPEAWKPLLQKRSEKGIYAIQFALAGMNAHINHDLPIALVETCTKLGTSPDDGTHHADYQKVDALLDAAEQSVREAFESGVVLAVDRRARMVLDLADNWSINTARDAAWVNGLALWECRGDEAVKTATADCLARTVAMASRFLLVAPEPVTGPVTQAAAAGLAFCDRIWRSAEGVLRG
jgi:Family of unknown function (DUF5995)